MITAIKIINDIQSLFFPEICFGCHNILNPNEETICTCCRHNLALSNSYQASPNEVLKIFQGRLKLQHASTLLHFHKKGITQELIHNLKYKGHQDIGVFLGNWMGSLLKETDYYQNIDYVIPVPLHRKKLRKRGYNQVTTFAKAIATKIDAEFRNDLISRVKHASTQTMKSRAKRWQELKTSFKIVKPNAFLNKHVLIVDDIITTGSTIEACVKEVLLQTNCKVSVTSMAITI
ncbi:ComF family protein [Zhouia amylolytica]|nr:phosphoribosyltransferase family protein [Zhouia amylolytica]